MDKAELTELFQPIALTSNILGMTPYNSDNNGNVKFSFLRVLRSIVMVLIIIGLVYDLISSGFGDSTISSDFAKAGTIRFLFIFRCAGNAAIMFIILIFSYKNAKNFFEQTRKIESVDMELKEFNKYDTILNDNYKIRKWSITVIILVNFVFNGIFEILSQYAQNMSYQMIIIIYPLLTISNTKILFYLFLTVLEKRFMVINSLIMDRLNESSMKHKYPIDSEAFSENIRQLIRLHKILTKSCKAINSTFAFELLLCITINFVLLIGDLHTTMYIIFFNMFSKYQSLIAVMLRNCCTYLFDLYYMAKKCNDVCHEASQTRILLLGIKTDIDQEDARNTVIACTLKLMQNKLEITACKLFNIDNALLFSICGAASSYLFIMLQLDMGDINNQPNGNQSLPNATI